MATRYGKTINGKAFHECLSARGNSPLHTYFIDGKRVAKSVYFAALAEAKKAEKIAA